VSAALAHRGYVLTDRGTILVQLPDDTAPGYSLYDDDQSWPGGLGVAREWTALAADDPRITDADRERLGWLLEEVAS